MKTRLINKKGMPYMKNMQSINFEYNTERKGKPNFYPTVINCCANTLSRNLVDYVKKGGDIKNLTPDKVYKKD